jgi:dolichol-phosphate mannosyltransferase
MTSVSIVTPMYNEQESLPVFLYRLQHVETLLRHDYETEIILVDDGSGDRTAALLDEAVKSFANAQVLRHERNQGFGAALKTGLQRATGDLVVTIDADTNYDQLEIPHILTYLTDEYDLVTGSPFLPGSTWHYPAHRFVMSRAVVVLYKRVLRGRGDALATFTCGFRVYRRPVLERIMPEANDFLATAELLVRALLRGYRIAEFPTVVYPRRFGRSKLRTLPTILAHLRFMRRVYRGEVG